MSRRKPNSRAEAKQATREALIAAGLEQFSRHGLDASLDDICNQAGLTRGAFYVHFADRDAFLLAAMTHVIGNFVTVVTTAGSQAGGIDNVIKLFFAAARGRSPAVHGGRGLRFFHLLDACHRSKPIGDAYRAMILEARDRIAALATRSTHVRDDVPATALADLMTITALGLVAMLELELPIDLGKLEHTIRKTYR